ncbi:MAG TPA: ABC transporter ATP-binding protein, partial [Candidatus Polarisedimenticolia bacterium]|nr:ABC transporter ATP-binding protein [Candidatus Polarisedimenticolia bacterium]
LARHERSALSGNLQEKIAGAVVVKAFHQEAAEEQLVTGQTGRLRDWLIAKARVGGRLTALANVAVALGGALVLWIGGGIVLDGGLTKGGLMAFYALAAMLFPPLRRLARTNETYQAARVSLDRILDFLDETEPLKERTGTRELRVTKGSVRFDDVRFSYTPGVPVLRGIDLEVDGGQVVALVGPNGAGKTTLLSLLPRFIEPDGGSVRIDGQDLRDLTLASLRRQIGIVTQEPFLFSGTIEANIRYGRPEATEEEVWLAARVANAFDFIGALPEGFRTEVGERGQRLSGGQVQRIALARAVINNPPLLILDEATSAVDAESERLIREALLRLMQGRTTFVIAHRISTVQRADRILVMDGGRIVEEGRHETLFHSNGLYTRICREQLLLEGIVS